MKFVIKHEINGRIRVQIQQKRMSHSEADKLQYYLSSQSCVTSAKVQERTGSVVICYTGSRLAVLEALQKFSYHMVDASESALQNSGRELNAQYREKLIKRIVFRATRKLFVPFAIRRYWILAKSMKYIRKGLKVLAKGKIEVSVLDAVAIGVSIIRNDFKTAGSVMFLLGIGEILEEWTHKKSVGDLARSMSLNVSRVWTIVNGQELLVSASDIKAGDLVVVRMGSMIPFDGEITEGEAMVNQASLTGEAVPIRKTTGSYVYAGTVVEEGELILQVKEGNGSSKFEKIVQMIENSEKLKSSIEGKAEHLADKLVPYTLGGAGLAWLLTGNVTKAVSVLMVDFSCALKLAIPISVLSAIREMNQHKVVVKGGKYLEAMAEADTVVFDKTGTLTKAQPTVAAVISFCEADENEMLRIAACMEEHFPHSVARAVVDAAIARQLTHEEMHSKVEYIVAHGISTTVEGKRAVIGSRHFVFEDEQCCVPVGMQEKFDALPQEYSHLYLAIEGQLAAVICIEDPLREEAVKVVQALKEVGIKKVVMMTGDSGHTARAIAERVGVDEYYAEVLPEDKADFIEREKARGSKVIMIGDGINDSPALSAADVGIAVSEGAEIARQISDVTLAAENLHEIVTLRKVSVALQKRIRQNFRFIVGFNAGLIGMGVAGIMQPTTSALLHNTSTLAVGLKSMENLLPESKA